MALLHEMLYRSGNFTRIDFTIYVQELCAQLLHAYGPASGRVKLEQRVAAIGLSLEQSMPCGLILSELVSNALKHAFPGERGGKIMVELHVEDQQRVVLRVADNGVGLPAGFDPVKASSLGLRLIANLTQQLGGQWALEKSESAGTTIQVAFRLA
jgi:two-component sensor histidine kinase